MPRWTEANVPDQRGRIALRRFPESDPARDARGGEYYGPDGFGEQTGHPVRVDSSKRSKDVEAARRLWRASEELTGVSYAFDSK